MNARGAHNAYLYTLQGLFLRGTRRGSRELKVMAVLLNAFGLSLNEEDLKLLWSTLRASLEVVCWGVDEKGSRRRS